MALIEKAKRFLAKNKFAKDQEANAVLQGIGVLVAAIILIAIGGLLASSFTGAAALPEGSTFNVSSTIGQYYPIAITIAFVAILAVIGLPVLGMILFYFGQQTGKAR
jgi:hypothetical protein